MSVDDDFPSGRMRSAQEREPDPSPMIVRHAVPRLREVRLQAFAGMHARMNEQQIAFDMMRSAVHEFDPRRSECVSEPAAQPCRADAESDVERN